MSDVGHFYPVRIVKRAFLGAIIAKEAKYVLLGWIKEKRGGQGGYNHLDISIQSPYS